MKLSSYAIADKDAEGNLYAVVTLEDGRTFGQWLQPGTTAEVDARVQAAIDRQMRQPAAGAIPPVGTVRTITDTLTISADQPAITVTVG